MNSPITKSQLCWAIVRVIGVYFILHAASGLILFSAATLITGTRVRIRFTDIPAGTFVSTVFIILFGVVLPLFAGVYFLRFGKTVHRWLMREPRNQISGKSNQGDRGDEIDPETTLTSKETEDFIEWLEVNPQFRKRSQTDQIALFRDAQNDAQE